MLSAPDRNLQKETIFLHLSSQKHLATPQERKPNEKFIKNAIFQILAQNNSLSIALENRKIDNWTLNDDYILLLLNDIKQSKLYQNYIEQFGKYLRRRQGVHRQFVYKRDCAKRKIIRLSRGLQTDLD